MAKHKSLTFNVKKLNKKYFLLLFILLSIGFRIALFFIIDLANENYWEYGAIAQNIKAGKGYTFFYTEHNEIFYQFKTNSAAQPSAFMPPGYVYFLLPFFWIKDIVFRNIMIAIVQHLISFVSIYFLAKYISQKFDSRIALIASCIILLLPEFIASSHFIGTTVIYQMIVSIVFYY